MVNKTSISAIRALIYMARASQATLPPRRIAEALDESPTYLAKVLGQLVKSGILRAIKGSKGGVRLERLPSQISLLEIVEACQGLLPASHCPGAGDPNLACGFHRASIELRDAMTGVLSRWSLESLIETPFSKEQGLTGEFSCRLMGSGGETRTGK